VRAARDRGYAYCAITEHSKSLTIARGFNEARVRQSVDEIAAVRKQVPGIEVLHGLEVDILADGALDLDDDGLALLDWVIVSLHSRLDQPADVVTARTLRAFSNPRVKAMAHPTGRIIGSREPAALDMEQVADAAAANGVALEINSQPDRLDLSDVHARLARERGVKFVIDTDSHSKLQLANIRYGVFNARRAGLTKADVLNTLPFDRFTAALRKPGSAPVKMVEKQPAEPKPEQTPVRPKPDQQPARQKPEVEPVKPKPEVEPVNPKPEVHPVKPRREKKLSPARSKGS
jgi:DNA polymerase (family 10)